MDKIAPKGRPALSKKVKLSCLKKTPEQQPQDSNGFMVDNTFWNKDINSYCGLLADESKAKKRKTKNNDHKRRWITHYDIVLYQIDKQLIIENDWISDNIVNASQVLLQKQYPHINGLQNVLFCEIDCNKEIDWNQFHEYSKEFTRVSQILSNANKNIEISEKNLKNMKSSETNSEQKIYYFEKCLAKNEKIRAKCNQMLKDIKKFEIKFEALKPLEDESRFVQILLDKSLNGYHWICISNVKTKHFKTVRIYDSDWQRINKRIENYSYFLINVLKVLFCGSEDIELELPSVTQSDDKKSGGVYAIAYAQALCAELEPAEIQFSNSSKLMRTHLYLSLAMAKFDPFYKIDTK